MAPSATSSGTETDLVLRIVDAATEIPRAAWDACAAGASSSEISEKPGNPFLRHDFFTALEESGSATTATGWQPVHLVLDGPDGPRGIVPCYLKSHSQGEYVFDHGWAHALERAGGRYYPKLQVSVPFTPATGPRLLVRGADAAERAATRRLLIDGLAGLARRNRLSSVHATFLEDADVDAFAEAGWLARTDKQFHWENRGYRDFDDFLATFASRKRKQVKRERRDAAEGVEIVELTGAAITEADWDAFFAFYMDTGGRKWGRPYLNRRFFSLVGARMADDILLVMVRRDGRPIAGALNFIGREALYGRYWGALEERPFLHFEVCYYRAIDFAIRHGLKRVEAGAQGEHKLARGYLPVTTRSAHFVTDPGFRTAIERYLIEERREVEQVGEALAEASPYRRDLDEF